MLILTGVMGSGKSTVGTIVAERLGCRYTDLDAEIVADADIRIDTDGKSVEDVAAEILCRLKGFSA